MSADRTWHRLNLAALGALVLGVVGCVVGGVIDPAGFFRAWLCSFLLWLGVPLAGITLVMVHDLSGGRWMATARPVLNAAIATMPLDHPRRDPGLYRSARLYSWTHPAANLPNTFYLNSTGFYLRYAIYLVLWNLLAAYALLGSRAEAGPIAPGLSWLSGIGLILLGLFRGLRLDRLDAVGRAGLLVVGVPDDRRGRLVQHRIRAGAAGRRRRPSAIGHSLAR